MRIRISKTGITNFRGNYQIRKAMATKQIEPEPEQELANNFSELAMGGGFGLKKLSKIANENLNATKKFNKFIKFSI